MFCYCLFSPLLPFLCVPPRFLCVLGLCGAPLLALRFSFSWYCFEAFFGRSSAEAFGILILVSFLFFSSAMCLRFHTCSLPCIWSQEGRAHGCSHPSPYPGEGKGLDCLARAEGLRRPFVSSALATRVLANTSGNRGPARTVHLPCFSGVLGLFLIRCLSFFYVRSHFLSLYISHAFYFCCMQCCAGTSHKWMSLAAPWDGTQNPPLQIGFVFGMFGGKMLSVFFQIVLLRIPPELFRDRTSFESLVFIGIYEHCVCHFCVLYSSSFFHQKKIFCRHYLRLFS